jgi:hypothetical protein
MNTSKFQKSLVILLASVALLLPSTTLAKTTSLREPPVKKSLTAICHAKGTRYYKQTLKFISFNSLKDCLKSGGRLPKR